MDCNKRGFAAVDGYKNVHSSWLLHTIICMLRTRNNRHNFVTGIAVIFRKWLKIDCSSAYFLTFLFVNSLSLSYKTDSCSHRRHFSDAWPTVRDLNASFVWRRWQTRTRCCGHIIADTNVYPFARAQVFLSLFRNILCPQQMFFDLCSPRNIMDNNVSATMCPRLTGPYPISY